MDFREFQDKPALVAYAADLLCNALQQGGAVMLSGGNTPAPIYDAVARSPVIPAEDTFVFFSDERMVPQNSPDSNYRCATAMLKACSLTDRFIRVETEQPLDEAARRYHLALQQLIDGNIPLRLGFLGLGEDGHTASLFSEADLVRGRDVWASPTPRPDGPDRVTVTPSLIAKFERAIFVVSGYNKKTAVEQLIGEAEALPAGRAVADCRHVSVLFAV